MTRSQAACNKMRRIDAILSDGDENQEPDFLGALGTSPRRTTNQETEAFYLPQPTAVEIDGARVWSF